MNNNVFIIVPTYNEANVIENVLSELLQLTNNIIVIDDGSDDTTGEILDKLNVLKATHSVNLGQGAAIKTGIECALICGADYIVTFDADGQHDASTIHKLFEIADMGCIDVILCTRFVENADSVPFLRRQLLRLAVLYTRITTGLQVTDAHNGIRMLSRKSAKLIEIKQNRMSHASEILSEIARHGLSYKEIPTKIRYTEYSLNKGQKIPDLLKILIELTLSKFL